MYMCEIDIAMSFLMLASDTTMVVELDENASRTILSSY